MRFRRQHPLKSAKARIKNVIKSVKKSIVNRLND